MRRKRYVLLAAALAANAAFAGETIRAEAHTPLTQKEVSQTYEPTKRAFDEDVKRRADELRSQPGGGSDWINRADQPKVITTVTDTVKADVAGVGVSVSHQGPPSIRSADEAALDQVQNQ